MTQREITFRQAMVEAQREEMARDERVFLIGESTHSYAGAFGCTEGLFHEFGPERVVDTPISEDSLMGTALGMAMLGMRPIVDVMRIDFITCCMDEVVNQIAKMRYLTDGNCETAITIRASSGGGIGFGCHHSQSFEAWFAHVPGLKVVLPSNPYDCKGLLKASIRDPNPVIFMEPISLLGMRGSVPDEDFVVPLGEADVKREGTDATIVAWGIMANKALAAAQTLEKEGISVEVVDLRTMCPIDTNTIIESVKKTGRLVVTHEAPKRCGLGAEIAAIVQEEAFDYLDAPIQRVAARDVPAPFSGELEKVVFPDETSLVQAVKAIV